MNTRPDILTDRDPLGVVEATLGEFDYRLEPLRTAAVALRTVATSAGQVSRADVEQSANLLARILEILVWSSDGESRTSFDGAEEIAKFIKDAVPTLRSALDDQPGAEQKIEETISEARSRWGGWIESLDDGDESASPERWEQDTPEHLPDESHEDEPDATSAEALGQLLAAISHVAEPRDDVDSHGVSRAHQQSGNEVAADTAPGRTCLQPPRVQAIEIEPDLLEAYLDDAVRCLASLEAATLRLEEEPQDERTLQQLCRELHTMKGASASVGLGELANYLHSVEDAVQAACDAPNVTVDVGQVLSSVDAIRDHIAQLGSHQPPEETAGMPAPEPCGQPAFEEGGHTSEETMRIKASQLDRLMDMLAELVMLRNRRESRVAELQTFNHELMKCSSKLRIEADTVERSSAARGRHPLSDIASDLLETARNQREICERISEENVAVSGFIRNFRQELTELQRMPVAGLFLRLQRAVRDAAHREGKKVRLQMLGEHAGLKRTLQERLYEPLLHIVRNAVSHGIESESVRRAAGKDPVGTIVLEALGGSNLLVLEIRDDGKGLDYDAIRRRGVERGLIAPQQPTSREELAQLIFRPGFSTKDKSSAVSGRGIGMDVVAEALNRMRSWVEVESVPGRGTRIRLSIPLRSVIEHTMVFRSGSQLLAVPMQFVHAAGEASSAKSAAGDHAQPVDSQAADLPAIHIRELFTDAQAVDNPAGQRLVLGYSRRVLADNLTGAAPDTTFASQGRRFELLVDEIIGPEEVVIRPLPPLLRHQSLFSGVTLSGRGKVVLLFDSRRLIDLGLSLARPPQQSRPRQPTAGPNDSVPRQKVLVADDSIAVRRHLARLLRQQGLEVTEVADGVEAIEELSANRFAAVFSDLEMPRAGGMEILRELAATDAAEPVPVVIVSSRDEQEMQTEARQLGASAYLVKPVVENQIATVLQNLGLTRASITRGTGP